MKLFLHLLAFAFISGMVSCYSVKPIAYLEGNTDSLPAEVLFQEPTIHPRDVLGIMVVSDNPAASAVYNQYINASGAGDVSSSAGLLQASPTQNQNGYLVSEDGFIVMPSIGKVKVEGMTRKQLADSLVNYFVTNDLLKNPAVDVRFLNYRVTMLGEVMRPGVYTVPVEKVSVLEALGLAGDLTIWARRDQVTVIREAGGTREFGRLDLTSPDIFKSPYFYLKQNDIVIIGQSKKKATQSDQATLRYIAVSTSILSTVAIIVNLFR
jgi:polysaccharide export outer membrane protein